MATRIDLLIDQGSTFTLAFDVLDDNSDPLDLSAYTVAGQMRKNYSTNVSTTFTTSIANTNEVTLSLTATETTAITADRYVYDVELDDGASTITRIIQGRVTVTPEVTKI